MNERLELAIKRITRYKNGERLKVIYDFENEEMDDFNYRMLENAYNGDLRLLADEYVSNDDSLKSTDAVKLLQHALIDINYLLKEGFDQNINDCSVHSVKDTIDEISDYIEKNDPNWQFPE